MRTTVQVRHAHWWHNSGTNDKEVDPEGIKIIRKYCLKNLKRKLKK